MEGAAHPRAADLLRTPGGYIPLAMSASALVLLLGFLAIGYATGHHPQKERDEGVGAHLYQLLIGCQVFPVGWLVMRFGWTAPLAVLGVLFIQAGAVVVTFMPLWWFGL